MAVYDFFLSRNASAVTVNDYVGHTGRLFYDDTGITGLRISDGVTPGGLPFTAAGLATASSAGIVQPGQGLEVDSLGILSVKDGDGVAFDGTNNLTLAPATETTIGGIKLGPGITLNASNQLVIDSEGLEFSFGDFSAEVGSYTDSTVYALLSSINTDEDIVLASNGDGDIKVVGGFSVHATNGDVTGSLETEPFFRILDDGQVRILVPLADTTEGGLEVIGSDLGTALAPGIAGTMLHLTGNADLPTRVYHDTLGDYSSYVFRRYNGSVVSPTQVLADEAIGRINFTAATDAGMGNVALAQIRVNAIEDQTTTAQGSEILFFVTPEGDTASNRVDALQVRASGVTVENLNTESVVFDTSHVDNNTAEGTLCWSSKDGTLNLHHADGVVQQMGQELYAYVINDTGSEIANGACVRFAGATLPDGEARLAVAPFEADGEFPSLYGLGIATQTLSDQEQGRVCVWGKVRDIDTTGQNGETWLVGDILYASPTTAGGLTKVKPTVPNNVVPVAAVLRVDATEGELFVRPTIEQKMNYGVFVRTATLELAEDNTGVAIPLASAEVANGISISTPASRLVVDQSGLYQIDATVTVENTSPNDRIYMWIRKNGVDVNYSLVTQLTLDDDGATSFRLSRTISLAADDYVEVVFASDDGVQPGPRLVTLNPGAFAPSAAAAVISVTQVQL